MINEELTMDEKNSINQKISQIASKGRYTKEEFSMLIEHLVKTLRDYLQQDIDIIDETIEESIVDEQSFCCCIRSGVPLGGLAIAWEGRLGMEPIEGKPHVSALLFLFSQNKRLAVADQESSYLQLVYEISKEDNNCWRSLGWVEDIYSEFEDIDEYSGNLSTQGILNK